MNKFLPTRYDKTYFTNHFLLLITCDTNESPFFVMKTIKTNFYKFKLNTNMMSTRDHTDTKFCCKNS